MKSQRRHELQHNVLDAKLSQFGRFIKKHANTITWVILIAAIVFLIASWAWRKHVESARQPQIEYDYLTVKLAARDANMDEILNRLKTLAGQDTNRRIAAAAAITAAVNYANQALMARDQLTRSQQEASATDLYNSVITRFSDMPDQVAKAYFGLGELAEGKGDLAAAKTNYEQAEKTAPNGFPVKDQASRALTNLAMLAGPVNLATTAPFIPASMPVEATTQPVDSTKIAPTDTPAPAHNRDVPLQRSPQN